MLPDAAATGIFGNMNYRLQLIGMPQLDGMVVGVKAHGAILDSVLAAYSAYHNRFYGQIQQIVSAQASIVQLAAKANYGAALFPFLDSVSRYGEVHSQLAALATRHQAALLHGRTTRSGRLYDNYLAGLPSRPVTRRAAVARYAGDTQTGLIIGECLTAPGVRVDDREELATNLTETVLEPWQSGPSSARADLFVALAALDLEWPYWLKTASNDIVRDGPKAASKVANNAVLAWLEGIQHADGYLHQGKPTRLLGSGSS